MTERHRRAEKGQWEHKELQRPDRERDRGSQTGQVESSVARPISWGERSWKRGQEQEDRVTADRRTGQRGRG